MTVFVHKKKYFELNARYLCLKNAQVCEFPGIRKSM